MGGHVVAAFRVSGDAPSKGARITELLLVKVSEAGHEVARLRLPEDAAHVSAEPALTPEAFGRLVEFAGTEPVVVHDGYNWKRFLRQEFASQPAAEVRRFLHQAVDVSAWSQQQYPKQRKDLASICKRLKIKLSADLDSVEHEAAALRQIAAHVSGENATRPQDLVPSRKPASVKEAL